MDDLYFRSGEAARELGVTQGKIRALCASGAIRSKCSPGGHYYVPKDEVERLKQEGLPAAPHPLPQAKESREVTAPRRNRSEPELLAPPSEAAIDAADTVARLGYEVQALGLARQREEELDYFREREANEAAREAERQEQEWQRQSEAEAQAQRREWEDEWISYALNRVPHEAPREVETAVYNEILQTLSNLTPDRSEAVLRRVVEAAVEKALSPWRTQANRVQAINAALKSLPFDLQHKADFVEQKHEAMRLAAAAISQCPVTTPYALLVSTATQAIKPIVKAAEHARLCKQIAALAIVRGGTYEDFVEARELTADALSKVPIGCSRAQMERACDQALAPLEARIAERKRAEAHQVEEQRKRQNAEWRVAFQLGHVDQYLKDEFEYDEGYSGICERLEDARRLKEKIKPILISECISDESLDGEDIRDRIEQLVEKYI